MMRRAASLFVLVLGLGACPSARLPDVGDGCQADEVACSPAGRALSCRDGGLAVYSDCRGPGGCSIADCGANATEQCLSCDTTLNRAGDACAPSSEGKVRCEPDGGSILRCRDAGLVVEFTCPPQTLCGIRNGTLSCYN